QDSSGAERVNAAAAERRCRARTGAAIRLPEPRRIAVYPDRLAGRDVVAGDDLVVTTLLLRVEKITTDGEGRPARSDRPAPECDRRRLRPVRFDAHPADDAVAPGPAKARPRGCRLDRGRRRGFVPGC